MTGKIKKNTPVYDVYDLGDNALLGTAILIGAVIVSLTVYFSRASSPTVPPVYTYAVPRSDPNSFEGEMAEAMLSGQRMESCQRMCAAGTQVNGVARYVNTDRGSKTDKDTTESTDRGYVCDCIEQARYDAKQETERSVPKISNVTISDVNVSTLMGGSSLLSMKPLETDTGCFGKCDPCVSGHDPPPSTYDPSIRLECFDGVCEYRDSKGEVLK